jgi:hypothetical protein
MPEEAQDQEAGQPRGARADQPNQQIIMLLGEILEELKSQTAVMPRPPVQDRST